MASNTRRAILTDVIEHGLDPNKAHSTIARNGRLTHPSLPATELLAAEPEKVKLALKQLEPEPSKIEPEKSIEEKIEEKEEKESHVDVKQAETEKPKVDQPAKSVSNVAKVDAVKKPEKKAEKPVKEATKKSEPSDAS